MNLKVCLLLAAIGLCLCASVPCRAFFERDVHLLTMKDGLSDNTVHSICKDRQGFVWLGTRDGLNRFDGKRIRCFLFNKESNGVSDLNEVFDGILCFRTQDTLRAFDIRSESFLPVQAEDGSRIRAVALQPGGDNTLWVLAPDGLSFMQRVAAPDGKAVVLRVLRRYPKWKELEGGCFRMSLHPGGRYLCVADDRGRMVVADTERMDEYTCVDLGAGHPVVVNHLFYDEAGYVWASTLAYGIVRYDTATGRKMRLTYRGKGIPNQLSHTDVFGVVRLEPDKYLAVTWNGYTLITLDPGNPDKFVTKVFNNASSAVFRDIETRMISVYCDPKGILWIGTDGGGGIWSDLRSQLYQYFYQDRHNEICTIVGDEEGYLWLATYHEGIMRSRTPFCAGEKLDFVPVDIYRGKEVRTALCGMKDAQGNLWFGNADGTLTRYDSRGKRFEQLVLADGNGFTNHAAVWSLLADSQGRIWAGTGAGLLVLDAKTRKCREVPLLGDDGQPLPPLHIRALAETADHSIWLGTTTWGVCRYDGKGRKLETGYEQRKGMTARSVRSLLASADGQLYVGYMDAFAVLSPRSNAITSVYTTQDGLCNNFIGCLTEDDKGDIWLGSNSGVTRYDKHQHLFYNYYISGSNRSAFFWHDFLFWGNNKNLTYFNLPKFRLFEKRQEVLITGLEVNNRPVAIGQAVNGQVILPASVSYLSGIRLSHANRNFSLTFSNLSYSDEQQMYAYRLYPYQREWIYTRGEEKISYANLEKGEYAFEVKNLLADNTTDHTAEVTVLRVTVEPHWTDTVLFRIALVMAVCLVVWYVFRRIRLKNKRLEHEMQLEHEVFTAKVERDNEKKLRMERERFFTEMAHELRTPLTLIVAPLHELLQAAGMPLWAEHKVRLAYDNSRLLHRLMDQFLYVRKMEVNMLKLHVAETELSHLLEEAAQPFQAVAEAGHYRFLVELPSEPCKLWVDAEKLTSAIRNLLSNAFKYTPPQGTVRLSVSRVSVDGYPFCSLAVGDTGCGIPADVKDFLFEPFRTGAQKPSCSTQVGIGMRIVKNIVDLHHGYVKVADAPGGGTVVSLYIPEGDAHFRHDSGQGAFSAGKEERKKETSVPVGEEERKKRLLVIDDNAEVRRYVCSLFADDYQTEEAGDGKEGVSLASEIVPDLIICDIMMPVMDGLECCREIKGAPRTASIPVLMLTAKSEDMDAIRALKVGADDYMMKPFNPEMLKAKVESLLRQRERLQRLYAGTLRLKHDEEKEGEVEDYFIKQVMQVIEANLSDEQFNVKALADALHMSQPTLYRKIKQHSRLNAVDIIRTVRVSKAAALILENRYSLQEVAEMVGYSDVRTLRKHFMAQFGVPPSKYSGQV